MAVTVISAIIADNQLVNASVMKSQTKVTTGEKTPSKLRGFFLIYPDTFESPHGHRIFGYGVLGDLLRSSQNAI